RTAHICDRHTLPQRRSSDLVNLDECIVYRHSFKPGSLGTITDPETGETIDWGRQPINSIDPSTGPGTGSSPGTVCMAQWGLVARSEEHTSELQSRENLVCRL